MTKFVFPLELAGEGDNEQEAWDDAVGEFAQDPGPVPENSRQEHDEPPFRVRLCLEEVNEKRDSYENLEDVVLGHFNSQEEANERQNQIEALAPDSESCQDGKGCSGIRHEVWVQVETWDADKEDYMSYDPQELASFVTYDAAVQMFEEIERRIEAADNAPQASPFTPGEDGEWDVEPHSDDYGAFVIAEARREELSADSDLERLDLDNPEYAEKEKETLDRIEAHKRGNCRLLKRAPRMYNQLSEIASCLRNNQAVRPELMAEVELDLAYVADRPVAVSAPQSPGWFGGLKGDEKSSAPAPVSSGPDSVVVTVEGGVVQGVISSRPENEAPRVIVVDFDVEGNEDLPAVAQLPDGSRAEVVEWNVESSPAVCRQFEKIIDDDEPTRAAKPTGPSMG